MNSIALIFDHDGTLVDSEALHFQCWKDVVGSFGITLTEEEYIRDHNGIPTQQNAELFVLQNRLDVTVEHLVASKQVLFKQRSLVSVPALMPLVNETLEAASEKGFRMAIATGAGSEDLTRSVQAHGFAKYIKAMASRSDVALGKPAPDVYLLACKQLGVEPGQAYAFEDTAAGIASAKAAGLYCVAIPNAYSKRQDLSAADAQHESLMSAYQHVLARH